MPHYCQHPKPVSYLDYINLPEINGIITSAGMDAFLCGRPAGIRMFGIWLCGDHADAVERGRGLITTHEKP
jgi:hypothetical protein